MPVAIDDLARGQRRHDRGIGDAQPRQAGFDAALLELRHYLAGIAGEMLGFETGFRPSS